MISGQVERRVLVAELRAEMSDGLGGRCGWVGAQGHIGELLGERR